MAETIKPISHKPISHKPISHKPISCETTHHGGMCMTDINLNKTEPQETSPSERWKCCSSLSWYEPILRID